MAVSDVRAALLQRGYADNDVDRMIDKYRHLESYSTRDLLLLVEIGLIEGGCKPAANGRSVSPAAAEYIARNRQQAEIQKLSLLGAGI